MQGSSKPTSRVIVAQQAAYPESEQSLKLRVGISAKPITLNTERRQKTPTRNTAVLTQIIEALGDLVSNPSAALTRLDEHFKDVLLINAGDVHDIAKHAEKLRLTITDDEGALVVDHLAQIQAISITIDHVEDAINSLFEDRFIEPQ